MNVLESFSLQGKTALLTGGAGKYGSQIAEGLSEAGAETWIASRNVEALEEVASSLNKNGGTVKAAKLDQGSEESITELRDRIKKESGRLDILVNNAVARPVKHGNNDMDGFAESMRINATGLHMITTLMGDWMAEQGGGSIVMIGSIMGVIGPDPTNYEGTNMSGWAPDYFFHKGGMVNYTRYIGSYYGANNIRCNCINPGGLFQESMPEPFVENYSSRTFLGRLANDTDLKGSVVFLSSDASLYITGAILAVDGGYTAK